MGSTRLPGKVLRTLGELDVLSYVTKRCKSIQGIDKVIVATSNIKEDDQIEEWCKSNNIECFRGSETDVLLRYVECAKQYNPEYVMRVTADCPFLDFEMASDINSLMQREKKDIIILEGDIPRGLAVELVSFQALLRIDNLSKEEKHREHVTLYAYENQDMFNSIKYQVPINRQYPNLRITLDTIEDYQLIKAVAEYFNDPLVSCVDVIRFLVQHSEIANLNSHIQQKPVI